MSKDNPDTGPDRIAREAIQRAYDDAQIRINNPDATDQEKVDELLRLRREREQKQRSQNTGVSFCSKCGTELHAGAGYCWKCGNPISASKVAKRIEYDLVQLDWSNNPFYSDVMKSAPHPDSPANASLTVKRRVQEFLQQKASEGWELDGTLDPEQGPGSAIKLITVNATSFWVGGIAIKLLVVLCN